MKVLVTGAGGQLGRDLVAVCGAAGDEVVAADRAALDITDAAALREFVAAGRPDVIINCAAWTAVDACESDPERAELVNGSAVGVLRDAAGEIGAHLVQVSTDYVFDGRKVGPYVVDDEPNPQSAYGRSKLSGERAALAAADAAAVVRTSWVCSAHGGNMVATIVRLAGEHETLSFVDDQRGHPTFTSDLAVGLRNLAVDRRSGVHHLTNRGAVSWFEFAQAVLEAAGADPARVRPIPTSEMPRPAARPANSVLSNEAYDALGYGPLRDFREPLAEVIGAYLG